jgi:futalosine hydrolase
MSTAPRILVVTAVEAERDALGTACLVAPHVHAVVGGIGRANAAATVGHALARSPYAAVVSVGIAGALSGPDLPVGALVVASECVYVEEGIETPEGFLDMARMGFPLGDFEGNRVPVAPGLLRTFAGLGVTAPVATVATCSGTDARARMVAARTGAAAEAMEGAAVVHAARRWGVPGIEIRAISNTTGDRAAQRWDMQAGLAALGKAGAAIAALAAKGVPAFD